MSGDARGLESVRERLWRGETLSLRFAEGMGFDVWIEKYGNPPQIFFEGRPHPIDALDDVMAEVAAYLAQPDMRIQWNSARNHYGGHPA